MMHNFGDPETGEVIDCDTGELQTPFLQSSKPKYYGDCETGEQAQKHIVYQRSKFRVPRSALKLPVFDTAILDSAKKDSENGFDLTLLILPLLIILPGWALILYLLAEVLYHDWAHSHEKTHIRCKTPMRIMFDYKCAECLAKKQMQKVGKLQDERTLKIHSRRILNYDYAQFGIGS
uniref:Uncharacterized protein n=1 Tax=Homalodisca liturata TaxID=320908 RepID=A0A1B6H9L3_9HEMI